MWHARLSPIRSRPRAGGTWAPRSARRHIMREHRIAAIPGDGIGPEVIAAGLEVLEVCAERDGGFELKVEHFDWGSDYYKKHGVMMPEDGADRFRSFDAIYFGAV